MNYQLETVFTFLDQLKENNNREWFMQNKARYQDAHHQMISFADMLLEEVKKHDDIETVSGKRSLHRIYRDVRFSKNKLPYKSNWGGSLRRATNALRGGYYYHLEPGNTFIAGGFWGPNPADMLQVRKQIDQDPDFFRNAVNSSLIKSFFGELSGERLKTAPKGFPKDHPAIDLLRYKQFYFQHSYSNKEVYSKDFHIKMADGFQRLRPFFDMMSEILTTDLNGLSLI